MSAMLESDVDSSFTRTTIYIPFSSQKLCYLELNLISFSLWLL